MDVFVAGGTGFVGRALCRVLAERGHAVTAASRSPEDANLPDAVDRRTVDVTERDLADVVAGHDAVVNLVALPSHRPPRDGSHESVHLAGTRHLVAASERTGVDRFVQMSGLGADAGVDTAYFRAKRRAEAVVKRGDVPWVIYRPSVIFGDGCAFLPFVERVVPPMVAPLPGGGTMQLQPIWIGDVAPMLADCVTEDGHVGEVYDIGGPERLSFRDIVDIVCGNRLVIPIPMPLAGLGFAVAGAVPFVPLGLDQYRVFRHDNVVLDNDLTAFDRQPADLSTLASYLDSNT